MTNEEMQNIIEFMIQRQEVLTENQEKLQAQMQLSEERSQRTDEQIQRTQSQLEGLTMIVAEIGNAQLRTQKEISNLAKIVDGLVHAVYQNGRGGGELSNS